MLDGGVGDDRLLYDAADAIEGGAGSDTLLIKQSETLYLNNATVSNLENIERLDINESTDDFHLNLLGLAADQISSNTSLYILGRAGQQLTLADDAVLQGSSTVDGLTYDEYVSNGSHFFCARGCDSSFG